MRLKLDENLPESLLATLGKLAMTWTTCEQKA